MKRKTAKILGICLMGVGVITLPFNAVAATFFVCSGGFTAGIIGAKPSQNKSVSPDDTTGNNPKPIGL